MNSWTASRQDLVTGMIYPGEREMNPGYLGLLIMSAAAHDIVECRTSGSEWVRSIIALRSSIPPC